VAACLFYFLRNRSSLRNPRGTAENSGRVAGSNIRGASGRFLFSISRSVRRRYILDGTSCVIQRTTHAPGGIAGGRLPSLSSSTSWPSSTSCEEEISFGSLSLRISPRSPFHFSFSPVRSCSLFASKGVRNIKEATGNERIQFCRANLSSLREVEDLARQVMSEVTRLDVLVNNAGVGFGRDPLTMPFRTKPDRLSRRAQGGRAV
jgi:hypothetical protein